MARRSDDLSSIRNEDVERFAPLVRAIVLTRTYVGALSYDEKFCAGLLGVAFGLKNFDPRRGTDLRGWLFRYADYYIRNEAAKELRQKKAVLFGEPDDREDEKIKRPQEALEFKELGSAKRYFRFLDARTKRIVYLYDVEGYTLAEIAKMESLSPPRIHRLYRLGIEKMRRIVKRKTDGRDKSSRSNEE